MQLNNTNLIVTFSMGNNSQPAMLKQTQVFFDLRELFQNLDNIVGKKYLNLYQKGGEENLSAGGNN